MLKAKKMHPVDIADRAAIAGAVEFIASIFLGTGRHDKFSAGLDLEQARGVADQMTAHYQNGRKAAVYAVLPAGNQVLVPADYQQPQEGQHQETATMATTSTTAKKPAAKKAASKKAKTAARKAPAAKKAAAKKKARVPREPVTAPTQAAAPAKQAKMGKRAAIEAAARAGTLPAAPDFSAQTHARFRGKLAEVTALAAAGDIAGLKKVAINPISSSPKALDRYRNLCVMALSAKA